MKKQLARILRPRGKDRFIFDLESGARVLDVGCGNASGYAFKQLNPSIFYVGIDVGDFCQTDESKSAMDEYFVFSPSSFAAGVSTLASDYSGVVWSHNIEHCNDRAATFRVVLERVSLGGVIYISFPCENSVSFPSRKGTLNYYDDPTHRDSPPLFEELKSVLEKSGFEIEYSASNYQPIFLYIVGAFMEPLSKIIGRVLPGTWEFWGFESVIQAKRIIILNKNTEGDISES